MKNEQDYIHDIAQIRSMMERSSKFFSLAGLAGILAGVYALGGVFIAYFVFHFSAINVPEGDYGSSGIERVVLLAVVILVLAVGTAIILSRNKAKAKEESIWNATSRRLLISLAVPLFTGGILLLVVISRGLFSWLAPFSLIFYGLAIHGAGEYTYGEVKTMGIIEIILGLICSLVPEYGLVLWAAGFGAVHILYGVYLHYKYER